MKLTEAKAFLNQNKVGEIIELLPDIFYRVTSMEELQKVTMTKQKGKEKKDNDIFNDYFDLGIICDINGNVFDLDGKRATEILTTNQIIEISKALSQYVSPDEKK